MDEPEFSWSHAWSAPLTSRLLIEAAGGVTVLDWPAIYQKGVSVNDISILDLSKNFRYGATPSYNNPQDGKRYAERFSLSYITGSHAFKTGFNIEQGTRDNIFRTNQNMRWDFFGTTPCLGHRHRPPCVSFRQKELT